MNRPAISFETLGGQNSDDSTRRLPVEYVEKGPAAYLKDKSKMAADMGYTRFFGHNPGGIVSGQFMQFDQFIDAAKNPLLKRVCDPAEWVEVGDYYRSKQFEWSMYLGKLSGDRDYSSGWYWWERFNQSIEPVRLARAGLWFDASADAEIDSPTYSIINHLHRIGIPVGVESWSKHPHLRQFPYAITQSWMNHEYDKPGYQEVIEAYKQSGVEQVCILDQIRLLPKPIIIDMCQYIRDEYAFTPAISRWIAVQKNIPADKI